MSVDLYRDAPPLLVSRDLDQYTRACVISMSDVTPAPIMSYTHYEMIPGGGGCIGGRQLRLEPTAAPVLSPIV